MFSLKVSRRLLTGFAVLMVLMILLTGIVLATARWQGDRLDDLHVAASEASTNAAAMSAAARDVYGASMDLLLRAHELPPEEAGLAGSALAPALSAVSDALEAFAQRLATARQLSAGSPRAEQERTDAISAAFASFEAAVSRHASFVSAPDLVLEGDLGVLFDAQVRPAYVDGLAPLLAQHETAVGAALANRIDAAQVAADWSVKFLLGSLLFLLLGIIGVAVISIWNVGAGVERSLSTARAISSGQLTAPIRVTSNDEFGEITEALNDLVVKLSSATVSKTYVENIVHNMADPLLVVDPDVCISMVNQALLDLLGYESEELLSASVTKIFAYAGRGRGAAIKRDIERGLSGNVDSRFRTSAGGEVPVSLSSAIVRANGQIQGLVLVAKDITAQKKREEDLIQAKEEAERMVHLRDAFLANMSHEIRTPLTGILGSAQVLSRVVEGEHRNLALIIEDAGNRLLDTINSVLEMARIEAGEVQPEMEVLDFSQEAEAVVNVLRPVAEKKGLTLQVHPPSRGRVAAQIDRGCLNRILNNLIGNAIKFTRAGGVSIEIAADGDDAILTVRDTGIGISKEFIPHLFDDFKQESTGFKRSHEGTGLGLAITRKLVEMMGGTIEVDSVKGLGSSFTIRFERAPIDLAMPPLHFPPVEEPGAVAAGQEMAPAADAPPSAGEAADRKYRQLLLIEDNHQNAYMARFMLEDYTADIATTPEEAMQLVRTYQYGVMLIDINLGTDVSGIDLLHTFRQMEEYQHVPAVAVTAYALPGDRERFLSEGFDDYVSKPYRQELLCAAVERALEVKPEVSAPELDEMLEASFEDGPESAAPAAMAPVEEPAQAPVEQPYPTASPDDFLPHDFRSPGSSFNENAARVIVEAERQRARQYPHPQPGTTVHPPPVPRDEASDSASQHPAGGEGDGARRPPITAG
jgi:PAS domain S-box-containing protein